RMVGTRRRGWAVGCGGWGGFGCWLLAAGCWLLAASCWLLAASCWLLAAGCWLLAAGLWALPSYTTGGAYACASGVTTAPRPFLVRLSVRPGGFPRPLL